MLINQEKQKNQNNNNHKIILIQINNLLNKIIKMTYIKMRALNLII